MKKNFTVFLSLITQNLRINRKGTSKLIEELIFEWGVHAFTISLQDISCRFLELYPSTVSGGIPRC